TIIVPLPPPGMLIEPQLSYLDAKQFGDTAKTLQPAVGLYLTKEVGPQFEMYYGGIIGYNQTKTTNKGGPEGKSTSFVLPPAIGVEHYFLKQFAIGVDARLQYQDGTTQTSRPAHPGTPA